MPKNALLRPVFRSSAVLLLLAASGAMLASSASAAEKLRVGKAVPEAFSFVPLDIGIRKGFFARNGLEIESIAFAGDARMNEPVRNCPSSSYTVISISACPIPWITPPCNWPSTIRGLMTVPKSLTEEYLTTAITPVSGSSSTSQTWSGS